MAATLLRAKAAAVAPPRVRSSIDVGCPGTATVPGVTDEVVTAAAAAAAAVGSRAADDEIISEHLSTVGKSHI